MKYDLRNSQISETVKWFEKKMEFIETCYSVINEVNIFNKTEVIVAKKYYRIYIEIIADLPEIKSYANKFEYEIMFFSTIPEYFYYPSKGSDENHVILNYEWICKSCKIRLKDAPFKLEIKDYIQETDSYFSKFD